MRLPVLTPVAQNRAYYAIFYIVMALGYLDGFTTGKHHQLRGWFNKYIYETKKFAPIMSKIYGELMLNREKSDYDILENPTREDVLQDLEKAKLFIDTVKPYVLQRLAEG